MSVDSLSNIFDSRQGYFQQDLANALIQNRVGKPDCTYVKLETVIRGCRTRSLRDCTEMELAVFLPGTLSCRLLSISAGADFAGMYSLWP
jgi:hypothetical protein